MVLSCTGAVVLQTGSKKKRINKPGDIIFLTCVVLLIKANFVPRN